MSLRNLSHEELISSTHRAVQKERDSLQNVIDHFVEILKRKLHLAAGYSSLYSYLIEVYKYSETSALRRVRSVKEAIDLPEIQDGIRSGEINLTHISELVSAIHQSKTLVSKDQKRELIEKIAGKSGRETQKILAKELDLPLKPSNRKRFQKDESVNIQTTLTREQYAKFERCQELFAASLSQKNKSTNFNDVFEAMADECLRRRDPSPKSGQPSKGPSAPKSKNFSIRNSAAHASDDSTSAAEVPSSKVPLREPRPAKMRSVYTTEARPTSSPLSPKLRRTILHRDRCCQFRDAGTGKKCGSRFQLEVDHIQPRWADGGNSPENLQVLCAAHNRYRYHQQSGLG